MSAAWPGLCQALREPAHEREDLRRPTASERRKPPAGRDQDARATSVSTAACALTALMRAPGNAR